MTRILLKLMLLAMMLLLPVRDIFCGEGILCLGNGRKLQGNMYMTDEGDVMVLFDRGKMLFGRNEIRKVIFLKRGGRNEDRYDGLIIKYAFEYNVPPSLAKAVIKAESGFNPRAVSHKGAKGLMQLMPATAAELGVYSLFDPERNICAGMRYLGMQLKGFDGNTDRALAAYNAGPEAAGKPRGKLPAETRKYIRSVRKYECGYRKDFEIYSFTGGSGSIYFSNR